jgi:riboflavin synthase
MFTGIVRDIGRIRSATPTGGDLTLDIATHALDPSSLAIGDSVCVQGVCLTVVTVQERGFTCDLSRETLALTTLGELAPGSEVNLEPALRVGEPLGGHFVTGHVDGVAQVTGVIPDARSVRVSVHAPGALARFIAPKGSVTLDGVSLTVNDAQGADFGVNLIAHTLAVTTLKRLATGSRVNLEVDPLARYAVR